MRAARAASTSSARSAPNASLIASGSTGSGEAYRSASRMARIEGSAAGRTSSVVSSAVVSIFVSGHLPRRARLGGLHAPEPDQLEEREEGHDHLGATAERPQEILEDESPAPGQGRLEPLDLFGNRELLARDLDRPGRARRLKNGPECRQEIEERDREKRLTLEGCERVSRPKIDVLPSLVKAAKPVGHELELLVLDELPHEVGPRILLLGSARGGARQERLRLDVDEGRRHQEVLPRELEVELFHQEEVRVVLPGDLDDRDIVDVDLVDADQVQQEIERSLEDG